VASLVPSGENATPPISEGNPETAILSRDSGTSQSLTVSSLDLEARVLPSGANASEEM
jgi:hypothetical protein